MRSPSSFTPGSSRPTLQHVLGLGVLAAALGCGDDATDVAETGSTGEMVAAPTAPVLLSPRNGARDLASTVELCWSPSFATAKAQMRYRVLLDGSPIEEDIGAHETTCVQVKELEWDHTYRWSVEAHDANAAEPSEVTSETWTFSTDWNPLGKVLFEDDFSEDLGWTVFGDATSGRWGWGAPNEADVGPSRPQTCSDEGRCWFTQGSVDGTTVLLSPPFDTSGASRIEVDLARIFHRESFDRSSAAFAVDLLVPDEAAPLGFRPYALERLVNAQDAKDAGNWTTVSFSACSIVFAPGTRLRVTISDHGGELVEGAIDDVVVRGYRNADGCDTGVGAICDPKIAGGCDDGLLCCGFGVIDVGYNRCAQPTRGLDLANPPPTPGAPANGALGCDAPDIVLLDEVAGMPMRVYVDDLYVPEDACSLEERCVDGPGWRRILRFDTITANVGSRDLVLGVPNTHPDLFLFSDCHAHYHFDDYARYHLIDAEGQSIRGHKQAFCLMDLVSWAWPDNFAARYDCFDQGISMGWADVYGAELDCQWIDITNVDPGDYVLHIEVNYARDKVGTPTLVERDYDNNVLEVPVTIP